MNNLLKNTSIYAIGDIVPKICSFLLFPILTKYLEPAEYAVVNYVNTINVFLTLFGFLCLNTYYLVFYYRVGGEEEQKKLLGNLSVFVISLNAFLTVILFLVGKPLFVTFGSNVDFYPFIAIGVLTNFFHILAILPLAYYRVKETPLPLTIINIIRGVLVLVLSVVFVVKFNFKAEGVLYTNLIISGLFGIYFIYITNKNCIWTIDWKQIREALVFSLPLVPGSLAYNLVSLSDRVLIDKYISLEQLGIYSTASTLAMTLNIVSNSAYKAFEPYFFKTFGQKQYNYNFSRVRDYLLVAVLFAALCLSLFSRDFFDLFSKDEYHMSYFYVPIIVIGVVANAIQLMYGTHLTAQKKTKTNASITIVAALFSVVINIIMLPRIGIIAAAISFSLSFFLSLVLSIIYARIDVPHWKAGIVSFVTCLIMIICTWYIDIDSILMSVIIKSFIIGLVTYGLIRVFNIRFH